MAFMAFNLEWLGKVPLLVKKLMPSRTGYVRAESLEDQQGALVGAEYVVFIVQVAGITERRRDIEVPRLDSVRVTLRLWGIFREPWHLTDWDALANDMLELCSKVLWLQYANLMFVLTSSMAPRPGPPVVLCHRAKGIIRLLAGYCPVPAGNGTYYLAVDINRQAWFLCLEHRG